MSLIRDLPIREQPVHRLRDAGPPALSTTELLACLLQTPEALEHATLLLIRFGGLQGLLHANETEITEVLGIGPAAAARIKAAVEFGRRVILEAHDDAVCIRSPSDVATVLMAEIGHLEQEHFKVLYLDTRNRLLGNETVYIGSLNASHIRVGEVFRDAVRRNCAAVIVAHNHPSGDPTPSPEDVEVTRQLVAAGDLLDIELLDHLVIGRQRFVSLRERGLGFS
jgi:DNA repair protein RadC